MHTRSAIAALLALAALAGSAGCKPAAGSASPTPTPTPSVPVVRIHFLGHAAFVLKFDNGLTVLSDYGDASGTGWPVQVFGIGSLRPDIVTYSQTHHPDHYRPMDFPGAVVLVGEAQYRRDGLEVTAVPTHELSMETFDSCGYLFSYKGTKVLVAGKPLQYLLGVDHEEVRREIRARYADAYDLAVLPVSGLQVTFPQLEAFIRLLDVRRVVLMHAASLAAYGNFLSFLEDEHPGEYLVEAVDAADYGLDPEEEYSAPLILRLTPAPYEGPPAE